MASFSLIRIQMIKFQFKRINHKSPRHYRLPTIATGGRVCGTTGRYPRADSSAGSSTRPTARYSRHVVQGKW
jgi:hypothetical protein